MGIIMDDLREQGARLKSGFQSRVKAGGGGRAIALRFARQQGYKVPAEKKPVVKRKKRKIKRRRR